MAPQHLSWPLLSPCGDASCPAESASRMWTIAEFCRVRRQGVANSCTTPNPPPSTITTYTPPYHGIYNSIQIRLRPIPIVARSSSTIASPHHPAYPPSSASVTSPLLHPASPIPSLLPGHPGPMACSGRPAPDPTFSRSATAAPRYSRPRQDTPAPTGAPEPADPGVWGPSSPHPRATPRKAAGSARLGSIGLHHTASAVKATQSHRSRATDTVCRVSAPLPPRRTPQARTRTLCPHRAPLLPSRARHAPPKRSAHVTCPT